jgi:hypothetical protein
MKITLFLIFLIFSYARENPFVLPEEKTIIEEELPKKKAPVLIEEAESKLSNVDIVDFGFVKFKIEGNKLNIETKNRLKKAFILEEEKKAVYDFYYKKSFDTKVKDLENDYFKQIAIGSHKGFYRVVIKAKKDCRLKIDSLTLLCL